MAVAFVQKDGIEEGKNISVEFVWSNVAFGPHIRLNVGGDIILRVAFSLLECAECENWIKHAVRKALT